MILRLVSASCIIAMTSLLAFGADETNQRLHFSASGWGLKTAKISDPKLPRVLLIGDSILNGYRATVVKELEGKANVDAWVNPYHQAADELYEDLKVVLSTGPYTVIHFNMGLHGYEKGRIPDGQFQPLTRKLVHAIREDAPGAILIWASSTPVRAKDKPLQLDPEINPIIIEHNALGAKVMQEESIPIDDLYQLVVDKCELAAPDQVHWKAEAYTLLGKAVAKTILPQLESQHK